MNIADVAQHVHALEKKVKEQADEIERLREENEKLRNGSRIVMEKTSWDAFQNASQEIERLREALRTVARFSESWGAFAEAALQQKDSE